MKPGDEHPSTIKADKFDHLACFKDGFVFSKNNKNTIRSLKFIINLFILENMKLVSFFLKKDLPIYGIYIVIWN